MPNESQIEKEKLLALVKLALQKDIELRASYQIQDKFRFIRDRLTALVKRVEESAATLSIEKKKNPIGLADDETLVYVYIFNAHGIVLQTWLKMLSPSVFYEYSVNRPIYGERKYVDNIIKAKANIQQHGYLIIAVKKNAVSPFQETLKDNFDQPLIRVKDGALHAERLLGFVTNGNEYILEDGHLIKKEEN